MAVDAMLVCRVGLVAETPPPPAQSGDPLEWLSARVEQMQRAWSEAGFPLASAGLWVSAARARELNVPGFLDDRPKLVLAGVQLVHVTMGSAAGFDPVPEDRFVLRPAVSPGWPDLLREYASRSVVGWFYDGPVSAGELAVRWTLERDGMDPDQARRAAAMLV